MSEEVREKVEKAREIISKLQVSSNHFIRSVNEYYEFQIRIDQTERELSSQLALAVDTLNTIGTNLTREETPNRSQ